LALFLIVNIKKNCKFEKKIVMGPKLAKNVLILTTAIGLSSCDVLLDTMQTLPNNPTAGQSSLALTNEDIISGLKEALTIGIQNSVKSSSVTDGFLKNDLIRLPFPQDALHVRAKVIELGFQGQVDQFETTLNRAAEEATKEALPIFVNAIKNMSIQDGLSILNGGEGAATKFLRDNTSSQLVSAFTPKVQQAISTVKLTDYWNPIANKYNTFATFANKPAVTADLNSYVTQRAITGLFTLVEQEENKIRKDPTARVTDILVRVFGSLKN
jgi:hypothetical protein